MRQRRAPRLCSGLFCSYTHLCPRLHCHLLPWRYHGNRRFAETRVCGNDCRQRGESPDGRGTHSSVRHGNNGKRHRNRDRTCCGLRHHASSLSQKQYLLQAEDLSLGSSRRIVLHRSALRPGKHFYDTLSLCLTVHHINQCWNGCLVCLLRGAQHHDDLQHVCFRCLLHNAATGSTAAGTQRLLRTSQHGIGSIPFPKH